jgi:hypothetical protein
MASVMLVVMEFFKFIKRRQAPGLPAPAHAH